MTMRGKKTLQTALLLLLVTTGVRAQTSQALYFMNLPQRTSLNPAIRPTNKVYVGIPLLSDINVQVNNNFLTFSDIFIDGVISDTTISFLERGEGLNDFINSLNRKNSIEPQAGIQLFGLGFTVLKDFYITFDITERFEGNIAFPGDLLRLAVNGTESFAGQYIDLSALRTDMKIYHEAGIGLSKNITEGLRVGARAKFLFGVAAASIDNDKLGLTVNQDYSATVNADLNVNISGPVSFFATDGIIDSAAFDDDRFDKASDIISYLINPGNPGFALDIGAEYSIGDRLNVSAALTDIGFIRWKRDRTTLLADNVIEFRGQSLQDVYDENVEIEDLLQGFADTLINSVHLVESPEPFTSVLPFGITVAGSYSPVKFLSLGLLSQTRFVGKQAHESLTLSTNLNFGNVFSTTFAYTAANNRYDNLGMGIALRGAYLQFYALVDNIPLAWTDARSGETSFRVPENWNTVQARLGLNLVFGNRTKEKREETD